MKDNFLLKKNQREVFEELKDDEAGRLIKGIFNYLDTGDSKLTGMLKAIFIPIKNEIDKNETKYQKICERNRLNGLRGGRPKQEEENIEETQKTQWDILETQNNPKKPDNNHISYIINHNSNINNQNNINNLDLIKEIIDYLNKKTNSNYKYNSKTNQTKINARLNEGYNLDDFIAVIDKKFYEWNGTEFEKYLCPETLFGTKFEKYLNQKENIKIEDLPEDIQENLMNQDDIFQFDDEMEKLYESINQTKVR